MTFPDVHLKHGDRVQFSGAHCKHNPTIADHETVTVGEFWGFYEGLARVWVANDRACQLVDPALLRPAA